MKVSDLILFLEELMTTGDYEVKAFHHEGGNSLRGYVGPIDDSSFFVDKKNKVIVIGIAWAYKKFDMT